jgi:putative membrane protein
MKNYLFVAIAAFLVLTSCGSSENDSVKEAQELNQNSAIDEKISVFLTEATDARMMDLEEGKLASARGTTPAIKEYGEWMVKDQTRMLKELRVLAASKNIKLPNKLSNKKADELEDLQAKDGEDFDDKFVKMMTSDHKRDIDDFEDATDFKDKDVKQFAVSNLPVIKLHLEKLEALKDNKTVTTEKEN